MSPLMKSDPFLLVHWTKVSVTPSSNSPVFLHVVQSPSDRVRPTTRSPQANRSRHRLREVAMRQALREMGPTDIGCYRAYADAIGSSPAWLDVLGAAVRVA